VCVCVCVCAHVGRDVWKGHNKLFILVAEFHVYLNFLGLT